MGTMNMTPHSWALIALLIGIVLVVCGFLGWQCNKGDQNKPDKCPNPFAKYTGVVVGFLLVVLGGLSLVKIGGKKGGAAGAASTSMPPLPPPEPPAGGDPGVMGGDMM